MYTLAVVESISLVRPFMNYQLAQHNPTTQWSDTLGSQHQQMSQQYPPSQYQIAPHQSSSLAASLSPLQVSCSTMQLQSSTRPQSLPTTHTSSIRRHTQYTLNAHQSPEPPDMTLKSLPVTPGRQLRRGSEHTPQRYRLHEDISPHLTHQIPLQNSRISPMTISKHLLPPLTQL